MYKIILTLLLSSITINAFAEDVGCVSSGWRPTMYTASPCGRTMCAKTSWKIVNNVVSVSGEYWNGGNFAGFACHGAFPTN